MGFNCGIVGLPNVGKSTLFNALTRAGASAENFPFCTIEPNVGQVPMPDPRLTRLAELVKPEKVIPTSMEFVDIAGLVSGASQGEGLGNQFLANIRETDAIAHVVRCFEDDQVTHVSSNIDPASDIEVINTELQLADLQTLDNAISRISRVANSGDKQAKARLNLLESVHAHIDSGQPARTLKRAGAEAAGPATAKATAKDTAKATTSDTTTEALGEGQLQDIRELHLITMKPVLYIANVDEDGFDGNPLLAAVQQQAAAEGSQAVAICNKLEAEIAELDDDERGDFLAELGMEEAGLDRVIRAGYGLLGLQTYFTAGPKEVRAWTVPIGTTAPRAAGVIHTDFEKGFIRAEVVSYHDYIEHGGENGAKDAGKWRLEGKDYQVQDGDVIHFRFNV